MGLATVDLSRAGCLPQEVGMLGALFQPGAPETSLRRRDERLLAQLVGVIDQQLLKALAAQSEKEFVSARDKAMERYGRALRALSDTLSNLMSPQKRERLQEIVMPELSADIQKQEDRFGPKVTEQAVFGLWTLGRMRILVRQIEEAGDPPPDKKKDDLEFLAEYRWVSLWSQFHLDLLLAAIKFDRPIREELRDQICDGLRGIVNAYAIANDALLLRRPEPEILAPIALPWDQEDEQLLQSSMRDLKHDRG
jgi:hypothetical protein